MPFDPAGEKYISLATFRRNGKRVDTPVWVAEAQHRYYVFSESKAGKIKRLRTDPRVEVAACDFRGNTRGSWREGTAKIVDDAATLESAYAALDKKYRWPMRIANFFAKLTGRYDKRAMIEIELAES